MNYENDFQLIVWSADADHVVKHPEQKNNDTSIVPACDVVQPYTSRRALRAT